MSIFWRLLLVVGLARWKSYEVMWRCSCGVAQAKSNAQAVRLGLTAFIPADVMTTDYRSTGGERWVCRSCGNNTWDSIKLWVGRQLTVFPGTSLDQYDWKPDGEIKELTVTVPPSTDTPKPKLTLLN